MDHQKRGRSATPSDVPDPAEATLRSYRSAAAVLSTFDSEQLQPAEPRYRDDGDAVLELLEECERVRTQDGGSRWMLRNSVRRRTLHELGTRAAIQRALEANSPRPDEPLQTMFERYVAGHAPPPEAQSAAELSASLQVYDWLDGMIGGLPQRDALAGRLEWQLLLQPFRELLGDHFRGRARELAELRAYVTSDERWRSIYQVEPLMIYGPGGVGKSTLLARFILDTVEGPASDDFTFCYWDFDRPALLPEEPVTLLSELLLQLSLRFERLKPEAQQLRLRWHAQLAESAGSGRGVYTKGGERETSAYRGVVKRRIQERSSDLPRYLNEFRWLVASEPAASDARLLLVLDTFERVQELSLDFTHALWEFLNDLFSIFPRMRVVVAGRAELSDEIAHRPFELAELDEEATKGYLASRGITNTALVNAIFRRVGGDPLSLHLLINALRQEHGDLARVTSLPDDFDELSVDHELNQGWLYRRYLSRIRDEQVRKLAHPGLVLRRVTPALIREVLAVPCKVSVPSDEVAEQLFERLADQASLVRREGPGVLRHRADVRKRMLRALLQTEGDALFDIHRGAVDFYARQPVTAETRAEELYHRLFVERDRTAIEARWLPDVERFLRDAVDEVPPEMRAFLISKLQITAAGFSWSEADAQSREAFVATRAQDALAVSRLNDAVRLLAEVRDRLPGSQLYRLEAQALERLGRHAEARIVANEGLFSARKAGDVELELDLLLSAVRANQRLGQYERARSLLHKAGMLDVALKPPHAELLALELLMHRLRLCRLDLAGCDADRSLLQQQVYAALAPLYEVAARQNTALLLDVAEEIAVERPAALARLGREFPALFEAAECQRGLGKLLRELYTARAGRTNAPAPDLMAIAEALDGGVAERAFQAAAITPPGNWEALLQAVFAALPPTQPFVSGLVALLRASLVGGHEASSETTALAQQVATALHSAFPDRHALTAFLAAEFPQAAAQLNLASSYSDVLAALAITAERQGQTETLVARALAHAPGNTLLRALQTRLTAAVAPMPPDIPSVLGGGGTDEAEHVSSAAQPSVAGVRYALERTKDAGLESTGASSWALGLRRAMRAVCRVERASTTATGFLVGPSLMLVALDEPLDATRDAEEWRRARFSFDYFEEQSKGSAPPTVYVLSEHWLAASNSSAGYALLRLDGAPGRAAVAGTEGERGWLTLRAENPAAGQTLFVLHHALGLALQIYSARVETGSDGVARLGPEQETSPFDVDGAPCFNDEWHVVAVRAGRSVDHLPVIWARDILADTAFVQALASDRSASSRPALDRRVQVVRLLENNFSMADLQMLAFDLGIDLDNLAGDTRSAKARELVLYVERRGMLEKLIEQARAARPHASWPE
jgi:hypothetical protein